MRKRLAGPTVKSSSPVTVHRIRARIPRAIRAPIRHRTAPRTRAPTHPRTALRTRVPIRLRTRPRTDLPTRVRTALAVTIVQASRGAYGGEAAGEKKRGPDRSGPRSLCASRAFSEQRAPSCDTNLRRQSYSCKLYRVPRPRCGSRRGFLPSRRYRRGETV